jgi:hypothetical protein
MDLEGFMPLREVEGLKAYTDYYVDVRGDVWSTKHKGFRKLSSAANKKQGYLFVYLTDKNGVKKKHYVHRLVAKAFIPNPENFAEVNHINRNAYDNCVVNLEWCNRERNMTHCAETRGATIDEVVIVKARKLHASLLKQGALDCDLHSFMNALLEGEIDRLRLTLS